jgi:hypothetical protein
MSLDQDRAQHQPRRFGNAGDRQVWLDPAECFAEIYPLWLNIGRGRRGGERGAIRNFNPKIHSGESAIELCLVSRQTSCELITLTSEGR